MLFNVNRTSELRYFYVTSSQHLFNITVAQLIGRRANNELSVFYGKLLVSCGELSQFFIYGLEGKYLLTKSTNSNEKLAFGVSWTPKGDIVYTTYDRKSRLMVKTVSGKIITMPIHMTQPQYFSISNRDTIYLTDKKAGVYQSKDDGVSWSLAFNSSDNWHCEEVVTVTNDFTDDFWLLGRNDNFKYNLRVYSLDRRRSEYRFIWRDVDVPTTDGKTIFLGSSRLTYDGKMNILLSDKQNKAVHVLSANGQHHCQLLSSHQFKGRPCSLAVDREHQLLYVGQEESTVEVFQLIYDYSGD